MKDIVVSFLLYLAAIGINIIDPADFCVNLFQALQRTKPLPDVLFSMCAFFIRDLLASLSFFVQFDTFFCLRDDVPPPAKLSAVECLTAPW